MWKQNETGKLEESVLVDTVILLGGSGMMGLGHIFGDGQ